MEDARLPHIPTVACSDRPRRSTTSASTSPRSWRALASAAPPLRLRAERQLGYKHAKYLMRLVLVSNFAHLGEGNGGYWQEGGYEWYAGI